MGHHCCKSHNVKAIRSHIGHGGEPNAAVTISFSGVRGRPVDFAVSVLFGVTAGHRCLRLATEHRTLAIAEPDDRNKPGR